jgi:type VI secretion system protein ImpK
MVPAGGFNAVQGGDRKKENLAFCFQEIITVCERLRSGRMQVPDAGQFRQQAWGMLNAAAEESKKRGYTAEDVELAYFAVVAFVDEAVLNLNSPVFAMWPKQPMQEERYGHSIAGEVFFQNLAKLMGRNESHDLADILEVYQLCLLLGFVGRFGLGGKGELFATQQKVGEKIQRIRRTPGDLSPMWQLPMDQVTKSKSDPLVKTLVFVTIFFVLLTGALFGVYKFLLNNGITTMEGLAKGV